MPSNEEYEVIFCNYRARAGTKTTEPDPDPNWQANVYREQLRPELQRLDRARSRGLVGGET